MLLKENRGKKIEERETWSPKKLLISFHKDGHFASSRRVVWFVKTRRLSHQDERKPIWKN